MNINLYELNNGDLINLQEMESISKVLDTADVLNLENWGFNIHMKSKNVYLMRYDTENNAKLARFHLIERWTIIHDMNMQKYSVGAETNFTDNEVGRSYYDETPNSKKGK